VPNAGKGPILERKIIRYRVEGLRKSACEKLSPVEAEMRKVEKEAGLCRKVKGRRSPELIVLEAIRGN